MNTEIKIYVGTYAKYNNGSISGDWLTLSDYSSTSDFLDACYELHSDEDDCELMFQDFDCPKFMNSFLSESMSESEIDKVFQILEDIDNSHLDAEIIEAYVENMGSFDDSTISDCREAFAGQFYSDADFAEDLAEQTGALTENPSWPYTCIDWEYAAREIMYDYFSSNNYYFRNI